MLDSDLAEIYNISKATPIQPHQFHSKPENKVSQNKFSRQYGCQKKSTFARVFKRGVAQSGSARRSGRRGRWFESSHPDFFYPIPSSSKNDSITAKAAGLLCVA